MEQLHTLLSMASNAMQSSYYPTIQCPIYSYVNFWCLTPDCDIAKLQAFFEGKTAQCKILLFSSPLASIQYRAPLHNILKTIIVTYTKQMVQFNVKMTDCFIRVFENLCISYNRDSYTERCLMHTNIFSS